MKVWQAASGQARYTIICGALAGLSPLDNSVTEGSENPIESGAVYDSLASLRKDSCGAVFDITENAYINASGDESSNEGYICTDYIPCEGFDLIARTIQSNDLSRTAFYSSKDISGFISAYNASADNDTYVTLTKPSGAAFVRISCLKAYRSRLSVYYKNATDYLIKNQDSINNVFKDDFSTLSLFEEIGVVGDSFASGAISRDGVENPSDHYNVSWPQILARKCGVDVYNYSAGGLSTRTWLTNQTRGLPKLLSDSAKDLYILALGLNDIMISDYLGTIADIKEDYTQNPDTFYGNYARIIEQIQNHAPNAKLIMSTMGRYFPPSITPQFAAFDTAIQEIAEHYGIPCMVTIEDDFFKSSFYQDGLVQYHPTAVLYAGMAEAYQRLFVKTAMEKYNYYKNYVG